MGMHFGVIGIGRFGTSVAITLQKLGHNVLAIDRDKVKIQYIKDYVTSAKQVDAIDIEALREAGISNCDAVVIAIGDDIESSIMAALVVKELAIPRIIAKATNDLHGKVLEKLGIERVVYPERDMGARLANQLVSSDILEFIELSPDYSLEEVKAANGMIGKLIKDLRIRERYNLNIIAVRRKHNTIILPQPNEIVTEGDVLILMGQTKNIKQFDKCLS